MRFLLLIFVLLFAVACDERPKGLYDVDDEGSNIEEEEIAQFIAQLAAGKGVSARNIKEFDDAIIELTLMGSTVEPFLIEALAGDEDWAVRYGVIHVLDSIGTKNAVPALIGVLRDENPRVAQKAMFTLRVFCDHRLVPEEGLGEAGLPALSQRAANDLRRDADELIWSQWHAEHAGALHDAWLAWWDANRHMVKVE